MAQESEPESAHAPADPRGALMAALDHDFADPGLLDQALTHPSAGGGRGSRKDRAAALAYERLEFLGDRVLNLIVADMLLQRFPDEAEGSLAKRHAALVRREAIAHVARAIDLPAALYLGRGEESSGGRGNPAILADALEAVLAALYRDAGLASAERFVHKHWTGLLETEHHPPQDAKTRLQEWAQARGLALPCYRTVASRGPAHEPEFEVEVSVSGQPVVSATATSKRGAEQAAAAALLARLETGA